MAKSKSTSAPPVSAATAADAVNAIHQSLAEAHATLDLLLVLVSNHSCADEHIESLSRGTLAGAAHGAMLRIEEAMKAANSIPIGDRP